MSSLHLSDARKVGKEEDNYEAEQCPTGDRGRFAEIAAGQKEGQGDRFGVEVQKSIAVHL